MGRIGKILILGCHGIGTAQVQALKAAMENNTHVVVGSRIEDIPVKSIFECTPVINIIPELPKLVIHEYRAKNNDKSKFHK